MPIRSRDVAVCAALGLVLVFASCSNKSPTSPRATQQGPSSTVTTVRLELVAPSAIAPGESVQLTANAAKSDGSVENVSSQAQWTPAGSPVVQLSSTGLATGKDRGEQVVSARFNGRSASAPILVLPKGTFRLAGSVQESGFGLENVALTVTSGIGQGLTTLSGVDGAYALYGVSGPVGIELKKGGYLNAIQQIDVTANRTQDFSLVAGQGRTDYRGTYTLTISAASSCRALPDAAKRRVYTANVAQDGGRLAVTLSDAEFIVTNGNGNRFFGFSDATDGLTFPIGDAYYYWNFYSGHFDLVERVNGTTLVVNGIVTAKGTPQHISGTLAGSIMISNHAVAPFVTFVPDLSVCYSQTHNFEMVRR